MAVGVSGAQHASGPEPRAGLGLGHGQLPRAVPPLPRSQPRERGTQPRCPRATAPRAHLARGCSRSREGPETLSRPARPRSQSCVRPGPAGTSGRYQRRKPGTHRSSRRHAEPKSPPQATEKPRLISEEPRQKAIHPASRPARSPHSPGGARRTPCGAALLASSSPERLPDCSRTASLCERNQ